MPRSRTTGDWDKAARLLKRLGSIAETNMQLATRRNAIHLRDEIRFTLRTGDPSWPANSPITIARKGSSKPLRDYGDLAASVKDFVVNPHAFFIGVPRGEKNSDGQEIVRIATIHEFGGTIKPKRAKALAIPLSRKASMLSRRHGGVRNIPGLFKLGNSNVLAIPDGTGFESLFILKDKVVIPQRAFIEPSYRRAQPEMKRNWGRAAKAAIKGDQFVG